MPTGLRFRFAQVAAAAAVLAGVLQIGSCATIEKRTSDLGSRIVRVPHAVELRFAHGLPTVNCWLRFTGDGLPSKPTVALNGVDRLSVAYEELSSGNARIQVRTRTWNGRADSVFTWGVGDELVLTFPDAFGVVTPKVQAWEFFRGEGSELINDSSGYALGRLWLNIGKALSVLIAMLGAILTIERPRKEPLVSVLLREQIGEVTYGSGQETKWMQQLLTEVLIDGDRDINPKNVIEKLTARKSEQLKLQRDLDKKAGEVLDKYQAALKKEVPQYAQQPEPPAAGGAPGG